ncbi:UDP-3-O-[3-hydroxymyristoyl] N-acetylglucosamine deacetylase [candidate division KSB3 bacterium]|uniref:UDP-3-O-acyl-N-acetylglucosamine deacetylase n=1 Tax=candidate division KSB3 bacterium TaxID=2044937 RepID=A0A2G6E7M1_9BACT|nr:MAG: UDP-3-O-[3-hydroxymyristoyl] N-acetylglucosamine deacetylase [candidate division KSB3 bacterium]PIE30408.1 MAG: UDP-3-O-[3-hydroxymyristoyl] N-acetylglucosamine deacetylase [candidate division KSB3 bacterium]
MYMQKHLKKQISCSGIGLHTGHPVRMTFKPATVGTGIIFKRIDLEGHPVLRVEPHNISDLSYATTISDGTCSIKTVEHVLSAAYALGITNLTIEIDSNEAPVMDGSAACFVNMFLDAGIIRRKAANSVIQFHQALEVRHKDGILSVEPYDGFKVTYIIDFPNPLIGTQSKTFELSPRGYINEISHARTFCLYEEVETLLKMGLSKGGSLDNAVVFAQDRIMNDSLRYHDEPVRHKILDLLGDLAFLGHPVLGHIKVFKGGHALHTQFVKATLAHPECWGYLAGHKLPPELHNNAWERVERIDIPEVTAFSSSRIFV